MFLYLVRHGESEGNARKLFFGVTDHPLTPLGREQAKQAGEKLREVSFTRCVSSDLSRAWDTAVICLEGRGIEPQPCPALREQNMGEFEDTTWEQAQLLHGDLVMNLVTDWFHVAPPKGESADEMIRRVSACMDDLVRQGEDTLVVAHNGPLSMILRHFGLMEDDVLMKPDRAFRHGAYSVIKVEDGKAELIHFNR